MRVLFVNDGISDVGGVQVYIDTVAAELRSRGVTQAIAYCTDSGRHDPESASYWLPRFHVAGPHADEAFDAIRRWAPDVCYVHNMSDLSVERRLATIAPIVKFMHGYFGTCLGGQKMHGFPMPQACHRAFGPACVGLFLPRRCGRVSPTVLIEELRWTRAQRTLFPQYAAVVVGSDHMRDEYVRNGIQASAVHVNPLFATRPIAARPSVPEVDRVGFLGRMTRLKGGDLLVAAVRHASRRAGRPIALTMIGDGPQRAEWETQAARLGVRATFTGWVAGAARWDLLGQCAVVALPSVWPEPFGLVGLEAGALGVPALAADVGGVRQWLQDGVNGVLVPAPATPESFGDALARLLGDPARVRQLGEGARRVSREMSVTRHVDRLEPILRAAAIRADAVA